MIVMPDSPRIICGLKTCHSRWIRSYGIKNLNKTIINVGNDYKKKITELTFRDTEPDTLEIKSVFLK